MSPEMTAEEFEALFQQAEIEPEVGKRLTVKAGDVTVGILRDQPGTWFIGYIHADGGLNWVERYVGSAWGAARRFQAEIEAVRARHPLTDTERELREAQNRIFDLEGQLKRALAERDEFRAAARCVRITKIDGSGEPTT